MRLAWLSLALLAGLLLIFLAPGGGSEAKESKIRPTSVEFRYHDNGAGSPATIVNQSKDATISRTTISNGETFTVTSTKDSLP
ncbi:MAG TPA: hypothetical protein VNT28_08645, partial [Candidatus Limnocylindrales bacterium]|nr:hypothetical protein [Candidatus Limnocylindrales bacterium]